MLFRILNQLNKVSYLALYTDFECIVRFSYKWRSSAWRFLIQFFFTRVFTERMLNDVGLHTEQNALTLNSRLRKMNSVLWAYLTKYAADIGQDLKQRRRRRQRERRKTTVLLTVLRVLYTVVHIFVILCKSATSEMRAFKVSWIARMHDY